jgi:tRNA U34 2-thiouridine synthase MnmA/TrmU
VSKDPATNVVFVSRRYYSDDKARRSFRAGDFSWVGGAPPPDLETRDLLCKVRHGPRFHHCTLQWEDRQELATLGRVSATQEDTLERVLETSERVSGDDLRLSERDGGLRKERVLIRLEEDDQGLAAGQYVALYGDGFCVGSGVIVEALEEGVSDQVSPEARRAAATAGEVDLVAFAKYQAGAKGRKNKAKSKTSRGDDSFVGIEQLRTTLDKDHVLLRQ